MLLVAEHSKYCVFSCMYPGFSIVGRLPCSVVPAYVQNYAAVRENVGSLRLIQMSFCFLGDGGEFLSNAALLTRLLQAAPDQVRARVSRQDLGGQAEQSGGESPEGVSWQFLFSRSNFGSEFDQIARPM